MMGIISYIKIGAAAALLLVAGYFYFSYQHMAKQISAYKVQVEQLEAAEKYYEVQPEIDRHTQEMKNEAKKAVDAGDVNKLRWIYEQLRKHKTSGKSQAPD